MAWDINEAGDIAGWGSHNGQMRGFLLTVPEPHAALGALAALVCPALARHRRPQRANLNH